MKKILLIFLMCFGMGIHTAQACEAGYVEYGGSCYKKLNCKNGGIQQGERCVCNEGWTGVTCRVRANCPYNTTSCEDGYVETGNTCQSGKKIYKECKVNDCVGYNYTVCPRGYVQSDVCLSGKTKKLKCGNCASGYVKDNGACHKQIDCKNGGVQQNGKCVCTEGWTGATCRIPASCSYTNTSCADGYVETGNTCKSGNKIYKECQIKDCAGYDYTQCPAGYAPSDTCLSGKTKKFKCDNCAGGYVEYNGLCIKRLDCKNGSVQQGEVCVCAEGWMGATCNTPEVCPYNTTSCKNGYVETGNTCKSGNTVYKECQAKECAGYDYTQCPAGYAPSDSCLAGETQKFKCGNCADGYVEYNGLCVKRLDCKNGSVQQGEACVCAEGWTGATCTTPTTCAYNTISCGEGYEETGSTCKSGNTVYKECQAKECAGYDYTECPTGYTQSDSCMSGKTKKLKCENCATGYIAYNGGCYQKLDCQNGGTQQGDQCWCPIGWVGDLCQVAKRCPYTNRTCREGYEVSERCMSGNTEYVKCQPRTVPEGYTSKPCDNGYVPVGKFLSGATIYHRCESYERVGLNNYKNNRKITVENNTDGNVVGMYYYPDGEDPKSYMYNAVTQSFDEDTESVASINVKNRGNGYIYGMYFGNEGEGYNALISSYKSGTADGTINIDNEGDGYIYGMFSYKTVRNAVTSANSDSSEVNGKIAINNTGGGNVYGLYGKGEWAYNTSALSSRSGLAKGSIIINNIGDGNVYGMWSKSLCVNASAATGKIYGTNFAESLIRINNIGNGDIYGMYSDDGSTHNAATSRYTGATSGVAKGVISINNTGTGNVYGMYSDDAAFNADSLDPDTAEGIIKIINNNIGNAYGMSGYGSCNESDEHLSSSIEIANVSNGLAIGIYDRGGILSNSGDIKIHNLDNGTAIGLYVQSVKATNSGTITIDRESYVDDMGTEDASDDVTYVAKSAKGGMAIGIYVEDCLTNVTNSGTIIINGADKAYGIYGEGGNIFNVESGTIIINGNSCNGDMCYSNKAIVLNGGKLFQDGTMSADSLNLNSMDGVVLASASSHFDIENDISGDLAMNNSIVENGFETVYKVAGMIDAEDVSGLRLISQSALFDAALENDSDAVMTMKSFNEVVSNGSLAGFLKQNYAGQNNEEFFALLKNQETAAALNSTLDSISGKEVFNRFNFEDMTMMRELNMDMNRTLFEDNEDHLVASGYVTPFYFESEDGASGKYALYNRRIGKHSFGLGFAFTNVNSSDRHNNNTRADESFQMSVPFGYEANGFKFITAPRFGYAYGHYNRDGYESRTYKGTMERRMLGLMNEMRYPLEIGKWQIAPAAEFNMIGYHLKGNEEAQKYSLNMNSQNNYSIESGLGLYASRQWALGKKNVLKLNAGMAVYHEFADPYTMELSMNGMDGSYKLRDERRKENRAVIRSNFDYTLGEKMSVIGGFATYVDGTTHTRANLNFKYNF